MNRKNWNLKELQVTKIILLLLLMFQVNKTSDNKLLRRVICKRPIAVTAMSDLMRIANGQLIKLLMGMGSLKVDILANNAAELSRT